MILREKPLFVIRKPHEEITEEDVWAAFQQLIPSKKQQFLFLRDNASRPFTHITQACAENSFVISNSIRPQANDPPIHSVFLLHSRFNHSCIPNSKVPITGEGSASPIIVDSKLKKTAEDFSIPLSARLIYNLLVMFLLEEEGLLDDFMVERFNPGILQTTAFFQTGSNARIARQAMAQETWQEKFCMAFGLYGRGDVADHTTAVRLRMLHGLSVIP